MSNKNLIKVASVQALIHQGYSFDDAVTLTKVAYSREELDNATKVRRAAMKKGLQDAGFVSGAASGLVNGAIGGYMSGGKAGAVIGGLGAGALLGGAGHLLATGAHHIGSALTPTALSDRYSRAQLDAAKKK